MWIGRFDKAIDHCKRAIDLDPLSPITSQWLAGHYFYAGRYDESIEQLRNNLRLNPNFVWSYHYLAYNYVLKGMAEKAAAYADTAMILWEDAGDPLALGTCSSIFSSSTKPAILAAAKAAFSSFASNFFPWISINSAAKQSCFASQAFLSRSGRPLKLRPFRVSWVSASHFRQSSAFTAGSTNSIVK